MRDLHNNIKVTTVLAPAVIDSDTDTDGAVIDTQGFESLEFALTAGELTDGVYAAEFEESDELAEGGDLDGGTEVAAEDLLGAAPSFDFEEEADPGATKKVGYIGSKRYVKLIVASTGTDDGGIIGAIAVQSNAHNSPVE